MSPNLIKVVGIAAIALLLSRPASAGGVAHGLRRAMICAIRASKTPKAQLG